MSTRPAFVLQRLIALVLALAGSGAALAQPGGSGDAGPVRVSAIAQKTSVAPGDQIAIAVVFEIEDGWHIWPNEPKIPPELDLPAIPTTLAVSAAPSSVRFGPVQWPAAHEVETNLGAKPGMVLFYTGRSIAYIPVEVNRSAAAGKLALTIAVGYQACDDRQCLAPEDFPLTVELDIVPPSGAIASNPVDIELFKDFDLAGFAKLRSGVAEAVKFNTFGRTFSVDAGGVLGVSLLLLLAALGGFLLNLTPCVLPVIPLKIMGLSAAAGDPAKCFRLGLIMSAGVIAFWLALGAAIATISGFSAINELFQRAWFSIAVGAFIALMGVGMIGLFTVSLPKAVYMFNPSHETPGGSFLFGVMTAVLSTPCTAPFMGAAAAWATKQPAAITMLTFGAIGFGMALPYLVLSANPKLVAKVPRTGPASELIKQVMGLLMLAVASWFLGIGVVAATTTPPDPPSRFYWWAVALFGAIGGAWLIYKTFRITKKTARRLFFTVVGLLFIGATTGVAYDVTRKGPINWTYYTPQRFDEAIARGDVVVIDFTAEWCLNCKALENAVLHRKEVAALLNSTGVASLKVDLTTNNPDGKAKLKELNWVGIPLLAIYGPGLGANSTVDGAGQPLKFDTYTPQVVTDAISRARKK